tara:strand:- start:383 stop:640 length:258 start_codon:yes stop_codon:yes gene_type:complete
LFTNNLICRDNKLSRLDNIDNRLENTFHNSLENLSDINGIKEKLEYRKEDIITLGRQLEYQQEEIKTLQLFLMEYNHIFRELKDK